MKLLMDQLSGEGQAIKMNKVIPTELIIRGSV